MKKRLPRFLSFLTLLATTTSVFAGWNLYEETNVNGIISGTIKKGSVIKMQSGSIYEVTDYTIQIVIEVSPEAIVLWDSNEFKISIEGFDEPLICKQLVAPRGKQVITQFSRSSTPSRKSISKNTPIDKLVTPAQRHLMGIKKLTQLEQERLRVHLIEFYLNGFKDGEGSRTTGSILGTQRPLSATVIESTIDGEFEGWEGETIVKLENGQIWQQVEYHYHYHYAYRPKVLIYHSDGTYKMKVEGVNNAVGVAKLK